ncbi:unnamed protein product [Toxocara canis]|uniref:Secreted protein n=1 Tax=Toxocara canis TaxID=6265 RepID=A0A183V641_TOXCA|nr:unnamed protein product [Toxocara canis]
MRWGKQGGAFGSGGWPPAWLSWAVRYEPRAASGAQAWAIGWASHIAGHAPESIQPLQPDALYECGACVCVCVWVAEALPCKFIP